MRNGLGVHMKEHSENHLYLLCDEVKQLRAKLTEAKPPEETVTFVWRIDYFMGSLHMAKTGGPPVLFSEPFSTGPRGYVLQLSLYPNGSFDGTGRHMSLFLHVNAGRYDVLLPWPFRLNFTLAVVDQSDCELGRREHMKTEYIPDPDNNAYHKDCFQRPAQNTLSRGCGDTKFISHEQLLKGKYIKNDCLFILAKVKAYDVEVGLNI